MDKRRRTSRTEPNLTSRTSPTPLFLSFLLLGLTAFGGPAMVEHIRLLAVERKRWLDQETFTRGAALCQTIPGATAMQVAAYTGLRAAGVRGAAATYVGFGLPAFLLMTFLAAAYGRMHTLPAAVSAFSGLRAAIVAIVASATVSFGRSYLRSWRQAAIAGAAAVLFGLGITPIAVIILAGLVGLLIARPLGRSASERPAPARARPSTVPLVAISAVALAGFAALFAFAPSLFRLATLMFRIDLFAFGGGFASVPLMYHEVVNVRGWLDGPTFLDGIVMGQVTPGPIVITASFVGYLVGGFPGTLVATIAVFLPSFLLVIALTPYLDALATSRHFAGITTGILCSFVGLLLTVTVRFAGALRWDLFHVLVAAVAFIALIRRVNILVIVAAAAILSVVVLR